MSGRTLDDVGQDSAMNGDVPNDAMLADFAFAGFELRLDERDQRRI